MFGREEGCVDQSPSKVRVVLGNRATGRPSRPKLPVGMVQYTQYPYWLPEDL
jgi:hypothetical protein